MVTVLDRQTDIDRTTNANHCAGCPRCQDSSAPTCTIPHPKWDNRHPVCKACGHCVLRGRHKDDAADLDSHPGFQPGESGGLSPLNPN
jgi:MinD superfamily P-loop ATPase